MNNNQFKKLIRERIQETAKSADCQVYYVDTTAVTRVVYIYDVHFKPVMTVEYSVYNDKVTVRMSRNPLKPASFINNEVEISGNYMEIGEIITKIEELFKDSYTYHVLEGRDQFKKAVLPPDPPINKEPIIHSMEPSDDLLNHIELFGQYQGANNDNKDGIFLEGRGSTETNQTKPRSIMGSRLQFR